jgi:uncharacterized Zn finger protein (UPF0148 family)
MYRKNCDRCNRPSFSSSEQGEWLCPVCGNDLTRYPFFNAISLEKVVLKHRRKRQTYPKTSQSKGLSSDLWG